MPAQLHLLSNLEKCENCEKLEKVFAYYLAPVLKKIKPAELIILNKDCLLASWSKEKNRLIKDLGLKVKQLAQKEDKIYLLFYDEKILKDFLANKSCQSILKQNGYNERNSLTSLLEQLHEKMKKNLCPHEIGLFLGYPPHDVHAFIKFKGKNFCLCKHWKVYHDIERSRNKFKQIDDARMYAALLLNRGVPFKNTVKLMKSI